MQFKVGDKVKAVDMPYDFKLKNGIVYTVTGITNKFDEEAIFVDNMAEFYFSRRFKLANKMEEDIALAKTFVGKKVIYNSTEFNVNDVKVCIIELHASSSSAMKDFKENGYSVCVSGNGMLVPVNRCKLVPEYKEFVLTPDYTAKIYKDKVEVGCQTIDRKTLFDLVEVMKVMNI